MARMDETFSLLSACGWRRFLSSMVNIPFGAKSSGVIKTCTRDTQRPPSVPSMALVKMAAALNLAFAEIHREIPRSAVFANGSFFFGRLGAQTFGAEENHMVAAPAWYGEWGLLIEAFRPVHGRREQISVDTFKPSPAISAVLKSAAAELATSAREGLPTFVRRDHGTIIMTAAAAVSMDTVVLEGVPHLVISVATNPEQREKRIIARPTRW